MSVFTNRNLNLKKIKAIGFDMDHTLVRYCTESFERLTYSVLTQKLVELKNYPPEILKLPFDFNRIIRGLVIDKRNGNLIKISVYGRVHTAWHGLNQLNKNQLHQHYRGLVIDLMDPDYRAIDTSFSISEAILFQNLVQWRDDHQSQQAPEKYAYEEMAEDIIHVLDLAHRDGSLKDQVRAHISQYIIQDQAVVKVLENFKKAGKALMVITNSDYHYTKLLMDYAITPFLQQHDHWSQLFNYVITSAEKPAFFNQNRRFLEVNPEDGTMTNYDGPLVEGIYQGGNALHLQNSLKLLGEEILYIGDHIYGDILRLKKVCHWRTALVVEEMEHEVRRFKQNKKLFHQIQKLIVEKAQLEWKYADEMSNAPQSHQALETREDLENLDKKLSALNQDYQKCFNPYWGELMRAGAEESLYMGQVSKYACIYMAYLSNFKHFPTQYNFRPARRILPHENQ